MKKSGPTPNSGDDINNLLDKNRLEVLAKQFEISGFSASYVNSDGIITTMPVGVETNASGSDVSEDSIFSAASLSKPLFAYMVLRLAADNQIDLDDSLDTFFKKEILEAGIPVSEWIKNEDLNKLTPRMLLQHRSGLPIGGPKGNSEFQFEPGKNYGYSGIGIHCLQEAITAKTEKNLEELAKQYVFEHCGMTDSSFYTSKDKNLDELKAENSLNTTAPDYAKFVLKWMNDDTVEYAFKFDEDFTMQMDPWAVGMKDIEDDALEIEGIKDGDLDKLGWGLGCGLQKTDKGITAFHSGDMNNSRALVAFNLKDKTALVYFANSANGLALADEITSKTVELKQGLNYTFQKYGFERNFNSGCKEREQQRFNAINKAFPPSRPFKNNQSVLSQNKMLIMSSSAMPHNRSQTQNGTKPEKLHKGMRVDVSDEEMARSAFGQGSKTAKKPKP